MRQTIWLTVTLTLVACSTTPTAQVGTLEIRISDHRIAIGDFASLFITLHSIRVHPAIAPRTEGWLGFAPQTPQVDLTRYLDGREVAVLKIEVPVGEFNAVQLNVTGGQGLLKSGLPVIVPGFEEAVSHPFNVQVRRTTTLLLDVIVNGTEDHPGGGYEMHLLSVTSK